MGFRLADSLEGVTAERLKGFFAGWSRRPSPEEHLRILRESRHVVIAWVGDEVAGFINAVGDGGFSAYIPLLEVREEHRHHGIGHALVERMQEELRDYYMVDLTCDSDLRPFYVSMGMRALTAMAIRRPEKIRSR
jgi:ribosomal protein S18 acetylase RimI-like enzyme